VLHFCDVTSAKPYGRFCGALHDGMTMPEVMAAAGREFPTGGRYQGPVVIGEHVPRSGKGYLMLSWADGNQSVPPLLLDFLDGRISRLGRAGRSPSEVVLLEVLLILGVIAGYLCFKHWQWDRAHPWQRHKKGHGIDAAAALEGVRLRRARDGLGSNATSGRRPWRCLRVASSRGNLGNFAYFRSRPAQPAEDRKPEPQDA
jgi:hypothetical protein